MNQRLLLSIAFVVAALAGCERSSEFAGAGAGVGGGMMRYWQGGSSAPASRPAPAQQPVGETGLARAAEQQPIEAPEEFEARKRGKRYKQATADDFVSVPGVKESHPAKNPEECTKLFMWFFEHKINLTKMEIKANPMPGNRKQSVCVYFGEGAQADRWSYHDMYKASGTPYTESVNQYPPNPAQYDPLNKRGMGDIKYAEDPALYEALRNNPGEGEYPVDWERLEKLHPTSPSPLPTPLSAKPYNQQPPKKPQEPDINWKPW